jgi:hypothetical protein
LSPSLKKEERMQKSRNKNVRKKKNKKAKNSKRTERKNPRIKVFHKRIMNTDNRTQSSTQLVPNPATRHRASSIFHPHNASLAMVSSHLLPALQSGSFPKCFSTEVLNAFLVSSSSYMPGLSSLLYFTIPALLSDPYKLQNSLL